MRTGTTFSSCAHGVGAMVLIVLTVLMAACASGGGAPPLIEAKTEALFADLTGVWMLDESSSTTEMPKIQLQIGDGSPVRTESVEQARQEAACMSEENMQRVHAILEDILEVYVQRPSTLILRVDEERLVYVPTPGQSMAMPMSGEWVEQTLERHPIRTRVYWDDDRLAFEHRSRSGGRVRVALGIVDDRLEITRSIRVSHMTKPAPPIVLVYDRDEGGE